MLKHAIPRDTFQRMTKRMPKIQNLAQPRLVLIAADHPSLNLCTARNNVRQCRWITPQNPFHIRFKKTKQLRVGNHAVFDYFRNPSAKLTIRQSTQRLRIAQHQPWRIKRPHQILAFRQIHARLATDGTVHLRQQGCRHMHQRDPSRDRRRPQIRQRHRPCLRRLL